MAKYKITVSDSPSGTLSTFEAEGTGVAVMNGAVQIHDQGNVITFVTALDRLIAIERGAGR
jgi:hypothetical protein